MQGLILAAGESTRLRPITLGIPKPLIYLAGKTLIDYSIEKLESFNVKDIGILIGYFGKLIKEYLEEKYGKKFTFIEQPERLGIAHAIHLAIENNFIKDSFLTYLSDNLFFEKFNEIDFENYDVFVFLTKVKDPSRFGVAIVKDDRIEKLIEKPKEFISDLALTGLYYFRDPDLVEKAFSTLKPSKRGEYEITELIQWFINNDYKVGYKIISGWWKDVGTKESLLEALYYLLDKIEEKSYHEEKNVVGRVLIERGAEVEGIVIGPAYIGKNVYISKDSFIFPFSSIEENSQILSGKLSYSLIQPNTKIDIKSATLIKSIVGSDSSIISKDDLKKEVEMFVSAFSSIIF